MTVNINRDSSCGINVTHLGGRSREETGALRGSNVEEIEGDKQTDIYRERETGEEGMVFDLTVNKPPHQSHLMLSRFYYSIWLKQQIFKTFLLKILHL